MLYYNQSSHAVLAELETSERGLSNAEADERLKLHGYNTIKVVGEPLWRKLIEPFANIFMLLLLVAAIISVIHHDTLDAIIIVAIMTANAIIYYVQRFSTERILRSLQKHSAQAVEVLRDGRVLTVDASQLVPGDIITLDEGDKVPADARLITAHNVRIDESLLTGESLPISKTVEVLRGEKEIYERANLLFQGSFVIAGNATAVVTDTGNNTEFGQLATLSQNSTVESPVQKKIDKLISQIIAAIGGVAVVALILSLMRGIDLAESLRFVMALSVSAVPESLPVAISVVLVLGMRRMASKKALISNMRAIETIGAITTIATDKTGTLTKNKLTVQEVWQPSGSLAAFSSVAAHAIIYGSDKTHVPLDTALFVYIQAD
jgi:Ca2+-transporting ATPase